MLKVLVLVVVLGIAGLMALIRFAPTDPAAWHVDPMAAPVPAMNGWLLRDGDGSAPSPVFAADPVAVLAALNAVAMETPRTARVAGSPEEGRITWVTRTRVMGYPDYTTAAAVAGADGTRLVIYARQRFGSGDWGVNRARVEDWVARVQAAL